MNGKITVLLSTEGTYPFHQGGVSTWCDILVNRLKSVDYIVYSVLTDPFVTQKFKLRQGSRLVKMPLWGTEEPSEHLSVPFSQVYLSKRRTGAAAVKEHFLPLFQDMIGEIAAPVKDPRRFAGILHRLYHYFQEYEYKATFKSELVWDTYKAFILRFTENPANQFARPDVYSMIQSLGWIYRFFNILNTPVPKTDVSHASAAAFCGIPCVIAKLEHGTPFLLTEHGVYLREQYLSLAKRDYSTFLNSFLIRFIHSITSLNYFFADQVSPVCRYNTRWETRFGIQPDKIKVIYNGVDKTVFTGAGVHQQTAPTVVTVARIDPIKDILTLIQSAAIVRESVPDVKFIVYGSVTVQDYYEECVELRDRLNLQDTFIFAGHTGNMAAAYQSGDIIALSSISEAFPYSVVEAMMAGKPCIATDVGGIREALGDTGILVKPRDPEDLASGIVGLLRNGELRESLGKDARERALNFFTLERVLELHLKSYIKLAVAAEERAPAAPAATGNRRHTSAFRDLVGRAYALKAQGKYREAVAEFRVAVKQAPNHAFTPVLLAELADLYNHLGDYDRAFLEMEKHEALVQLLESRKTA